MRRFRLSLGAQGSSGSLRTFFCCLVLLLPFYGVPDKEVVTGNHEPHAAGMGAPPPPLLESYSRFTAFSNPERRPLGTLPVAAYLGAVKPFWNTVLPLLVTPEVRYKDLAMFQQWQLEGG